MLITRRPPANRAASFIAHLFKVIASEASVAPSHVATTNATLPTGHDALLGGAALTS
jgi:hypothetical protein